MANNGIDPMELFMEQMDLSGRYHMINNPEPKPRTTKLIPIAERANLTCAKCGTNLSVKYRKVVNGKEECFCNRCILFVE
jgi:hypothetical protein